MTPFLTAVRRPPTVNHRFQQGLDDSSRRLSNPPTIHICISSVAAPLPPLLSQYSSAVDFRSPLLCRIQPRFPACQATMQRRFSCGSSLPESSSHYSLYRFQPRLRKLSFNERMDLSFILLSRSTTHGGLPTIKATYGMDLTQKKHIKSFLRDEKENARNPDSIGSCSRRVILILPVVSSGLFPKYFALAKVKTNLFNENRLLEQNKKIQEANQAPKDFPNFIREGFQVKVVASDKYVKSNSGLIYLDIQSGNGDCPKDGQQVTFHYIGYNESGRRIDSTYLRGSPAKIRLGNNALVPGFEEGIHDMRPGGKRRIIIPPELGPPVGPGTFFSSKQFEVFDVELLNIKDCQRRTIAFYSDVVCN